MKSTLLVATVLAVALTGCSDAGKARSQADAAKPAQPQAEAELARAKKADAAKATQAKAEAARSELAKIKAQDRQRNENKRSVEEEVKRQLEANKRERDDRLTKLALRKQAEIPPLENEVVKIQGQISTLDKKMENLRAQQRSLPVLSFGIPQGTKFQPTINQMQMREIEMKAIQQWEAVQKEYDRLRAEYLGNLRTAEDRLQKKGQELKKERQKILGDF